MANYGFVYVLTNQSMPGYYKVGFTDRAPLQRVSELSSGTSVPVPFDIVCYGEFYDAREYEQWMHGELSEYRTRSNREFFCMSFETLNSVVLRIKENSENFIEGFTFAELKHKNEVSDRKLYRDWIRYQFMVQSHDEMSFGD